MPLKKEKAGVTKKSKAEDKGSAAKSRLVEERQRSFHMAFDPAPVAAKALTSGLHKTAVVIEPKPEDSGPQTKTGAKWRQGG